MMNAYEAFCLGADGHSQKVQMNVEQSITAWILTREVKNMLGPGCSGRASCKHTNPLQGVLSSEIAS